MLDGFLAIGCGNDFLVILECTHKGATNECFVIHDKDSRRSVPVDGAGTTAFGVSGCSGCTLVGVR